MNKWVSLCACLALAVSLVGSTAYADQFWGSGSADWGVAGAALFKLDTATGTVGTTHTYSDWSWIMDVTCAPGNTLYAVHNVVGDLYNFKLARIDAGTGAVLSDTLMSTITGTDYPQWNALEYLNGKLYGVENSTADAYNATAYPDWNGSANAKRGSAYEVSLDGNGDPVSSTAGAYVGPYPDGALAYKDGTWYASDWNTDNSSWIKKSTDIMGTGFAAQVGTSPVGLFDGWDFDSSGRMLGVSWYAGFDVYQIDPTTGAATALYNIQSQLPSQIISLSGLSAVVPEPSSIVGLAGCLASLLLWRRRRA